MTHTITYYKIKHIDDDTKESFICSAVNIKQRNNRTAKDTYIGRYMRKNGGRKKWIYDLLESKVFNTKQQRYIREHELHIEHNIEPSILLIYACRVYPS
jgi:hypothetical protein